MRSRRPPTHGDHRGPAGDREAATPSRTRLREFSRSLPMSLLKAREAAMSHFRPRLHHFGITEQQWRVLRALTAVDTIEILALSRATFLLPQSLSRILKDLDKRELIARRTSKEDLRRGLVSISPRGRKLVEQSGIYSEVIYAEITRRYGAERLELLEQLLRELETALADPIATPKLPAVRTQGRPKRGRPPKS
jgi:homoprotocatechuate degradation regulator HpaR